MLRDIELTDDLIAILRQIDETKARIHSRPAPPEAVLQKLEQEWIADTVYHGMRLDTYMRETHGRD